MSNPIKRLVRLRKFTPASDPANYLGTEHRQNLKAIEDSFTEIKPVNFSVVSSTSTVYANLSPVVFDDVEFDTDDAYSPTTGLYTVPSSGRYVFSVALNIDATTFSAGNPVVFRLRQNKSTYISAGFREATGNFSVFVDHVSRPLALLKGDTVGFLLSSAGTSPRISQDVNDPIANYFSGWKVGGYL